MVLVAVIFLVTSCQSSKKPVLQETKVVETNEIPTQTGTATITPPPTSENIHIPEFLNGESANKTSPQFRLWMEPTEEELTPPVNLDCQDEKSTVYLSLKGILLNNHCIIETGPYEALIVLPDFSMAIIDQNTTAQFNFSDKGTEIILQKGAIYSVIAEQKKGQNFVVNTGNLILTAKGTEFGVMIKNMITTVVMQAGEVVSTICEKWDNQICTSWKETDGALIPFRQYSRSVDGQEWKESELSMNWQVNGEIGIPFFDTAGFISLAFLEHSVLQAGKDYKKSIDKNDILDSLYDFAEVTLMGGFSKEERDLFKGKSDEDIMQMASEKNKYLKSIYCEANPIICFSPKDQPVLVTVNPGITEAPSTGGSTSGDACAGVPAFLLARITSCDCNHKSSYGIFCQLDSGDNGWYPEACVRPKGLCQ